MLRRRMMLPLVRRRLQMRPFSSKGGDGSDGVRGSARTIEIAGVSAPLRPAQRPELVPRGFVDDLFAGAEGDAETLATLRWMLQKDLLKQDIFLIGGPGPERRNLAQAFAELVDREVEYVAISRDTTEADLKQRRELRAGSSVFADAPPVRAALKGRLLILDGIEKAERNVLPTLNNLLENREMALDDGRFLMRDSTFDAIVEEVRQGSSGSGSGGGGTEGAVAAGGGEGQLQSLCRVHPDFRVVALGLPVPPYPGYSLDPPLRSRFQARVVSPPPAAAVADHLSRRAPGLDDAVARSLVVTAESLRLFENQARAGDDQGGSGSGGGSSGGGGGSSGKGGAMFPTFPHWALSDIATAAAAEGGSKEQQQRRVRDALLRSYPALQEGLRGAHDNVFVKAANDILQKHFPVSSSAAAAAAPSPSSGNAAFVATPAVSGLLGAMEEDLRSGRDVCLVGVKGGGKSAVVAELAARLIASGEEGEEGGYSPSGGVSTLPVFKDMTARDLLQRRGTDPATGATTWEDSPLVAAARTGGLLVLDGVERLPSDVLNTLQRLAHDRYLDLCDGTRLVPKGSSAAADSGGTATTSAVSSDEDVVCQAMHPDFRIVALADPPPAGKGSWLSPETSTLFRFHRLAPHSASDKASILRAQSPALPAEVLQQLIDFSDALSPPAAAAAATASPADLEETAAAGSGAGTAAGRQQQLSLRQLCRLARRLEQFPETAAADLPALLSNALLLPFMPPAPQKTVHAAMEAAGIRSPSPPAAVAGGKGAEALEGSASDGFLRIGRVVAPKRKAARPELVPSPLFFENEAHTALMEEMLASHASGEKALLLIGNQGVGKNKVADRLLQRLGAEREYVQLHRDTTLQSLTVLPSLEDGRIAWEDSPLVRAVTQGRVLVVDEADKAPTEVVCLLKTLLEDGEMLLGDGRRILSKENLRRWQVATGNRDDDPSVHGIVPVHDDFAMWVLANRPGFPFLGNNFFREIGDAFSVFVLHNPDQDSEEALLANYAPTLSGKEDGRLVLSKLAGAFADLRSLHSDAGGGGSGGGGGVAAATGQLTYPYSMREAVAVITHLNSFPEDGVVEALENVLAFDSFTPETRALVAGVFQRHGIPLPLQAGKGLKAPKVELGEVLNLPEQELFEKWTTKLNDDDDDDDDDRHGGGTGSTMGSGGGSSSNGGGGGGGGGGVSGGSGEPTAALVDDAPVRMRKWGLGRPSERSWVVSSARLETFTEEVGSFNIWGDTPSSSSSGNMRRMARRHSAVAIACAHDCGSPAKAPQRIHVLSRDPMVLHSFDGASGGGGLQRSTELLGDMWEYRMQHDSPRLVPLALSDDDQGLHRGQGGGGQRQPAMAVVFPRQGAVLVLDDSVGGDEALNGSGGGGVLLEISEPTATSGAGDGDAMAASEDSSSSMFASFLARSSGGSSVAGGLRRKGKRGGPFGGGGVDAVTHVGSSLGGQGCVFYFEEGSSTISVVHCGTSRAARGGGTGGESTACHVHVPEAALPGEGLAAVEVLTPDSWVLRGVAPGAASALRWPRGLPGSLSYSGASAAERAPIIERVKVTGPDGAVLNKVAASSSSSSTTRPPMVVHNKGAAPAAPSLFEPDGRFLAHPDSHVQVAHGDGARRPMHVHVYSSPAPAASSHAARTIHLRPSSSMLPAADDGDATSSPSLFKRTDSEGKPINLGFASTRGGGFTGAAVSDGDRTAGEDDGGGGDDESASDLVVSVVRRGGGSAALESVDLTRRLLRTVSLSPAPASSSGDDDSGRHLNHFDGYGDDDGPAPVVDICALPVATARATAAATAAAAGDGESSFEDASNNSAVAGLATLQSDGGVRLWQVEEHALESEVKAWKRMYGIVDKDEATTTGGNAIEELSRSGGVTYRDEGGKSIPRTGISAPKHGKEDAKNEPHVGGNTWAGGTGGSDTAGLGGRGGPYRLDKGHTVHQISDEEKAKMSKEALAAARAMGRQGLEDRLREINMGEGEWETYLRYFQRIQPQVQQLRNVLEALEQKESERVWLRHQASGELDDSKLLDGMAGERLVFRRRGESQDPFFNPHKQQNDKAEKTRLLFAVDVSGSMFRFNGSDGRLERLLECTMMIMEALDGFEAKFEYALIGHSGDSPQIPFVDFGQPPVTRKERLAVLQKMVAHSQFCWSGDHTVEAAEESVTSVRAGESGGAGDYDEGVQPRHFVFLLSDANLRRYGIDARDLGRSLTRDPEVQGHFVMIASIADEAQRALEVMPPGSASVCLDAAQLPQLIKTIITASIDTF